MKANAILVLSLIWTFSTAAQDASRNQPLCSSQDDFVVSEVVFEEANHLSPQEQAMLKLRLIGHCFESFNIAGTGATVLTAFQNAGYFRALVRDPIVRVRAASRSPKPVALVFDVVEGDQYKVRE